MSDELQNKKQKLEAAKKTQKALKAELHYLESVQEEFKQHTDQEKMKEIRKKL